MGQLRKWRRMHKAHKKELKRQGKKHDKKHRSKKIRVKADRRQKKMAKKGIEVHKQYPEQKWQRELREREQPKPKDS